MRFRTIIVAAAVPAATAGLLLTTTAAASAATVGPAATASAVSHQTSWMAFSHLTGRTEGGGNGSWAEDDIYRVMTIKLTGQSGGVYSYTATVYDAVQLQTSNRVFSRACVSCHAQIHGSNHPSGNFLVR